MPSQRNFPPQHAWLAYCNRQLFHDHAVERQNKKETYGLKSHVPLCTSRERRLIAEWVPDEVKALWRSR
jgi:hypothetical protein